MTYLLRQRYNVMQINKHEMNFAMSPDSAVKC